MPNIKAGGGFPWEIDPEVKFNNELTQDREVIRVGKAQKLE